jgi:hypothetical protein
MMPYEPPRRRRSPWFFIGLGMLGLLVIWSILLHISVWYTNTFYDPGHYTQTVHLDTVTITDAQGHQSQARAFIDAQNRLDILVIPSGDPSKAHIIIGPALSNIDDPQHRATITATAHGTMVTVRAQGPFAAGWADFIANQQSEEWTTEASQQPSNKGGK